MVNSALTTNNALLKMLDLKLKMLIEDDLKNFRMIKQAKTNPAKANLP
ncbi:MAG: hypothetical protein ABIN13_09700 [Mucilaginibacter sp.]